MRPQFKLFGFPIRVDPSFALVVLFGLTTESLALSVAWPVVVFVTTLVHELGHAFAFRAFGRQAAVTLWGFGGYTQGSGGPLEPRKTRAVVFAGPLAGMILLGVPALLVSKSLHGATPVTTAIVRMVVFVAVGWSAANLLPIIPLDGGRIAASYLEGRWGIPGARAARVIGIAVALAGGGYAFARGYQFAALFALFFVAQNVRDIAVLGDASLGGGLEEARRRLASREYALAARAAQEVAAKAKGGALKAAAIDVQARALLSSGLRAEAARAVEHLPADTAVARDLLALFLHADGRYGDAAAVGAHAFDEARGSPDAGVIAYNVACSLARDGRAPEAVEWLERAVHTGFGDAGRLRSDPDLASLQSTEPFERLMSGLR